MRVKRINKKGTKYNMGVTEEMNKSITDCNMNNKEISLESILMIIAYKFNRYFNEGKTQSVSVPIEEVFKIYSYLARELVITGVEDKFGIDFNPTVEKILNTIANSKSLHMSTKTSFWLSKIPDLSNLDIPTCVEAIIDRYMTKNVVTINTTKSIETLGNQAAAIAGQIIKFNNLTYNLTDEEQNKFVPLKGLDEKDFNKIKSTIIDMLTDCYTKKTTELAELVRANNN